MVQCSIASDSQELIYLSIHPCERDCQSGRAVRNSSSANTVSQSLQFTRLCRRTTTQSPSTGRYFLLGRPTVSCHATGGGGFPVISHCVTRNPCEKLNLAVLVLMSPRGIR